MKKLVIKCSSFFKYTRLVMITWLLISSSDVIAQTDGQVSSPADAVAATSSKKKSIVKNTFESNLILDGQTVMVPNKGTFEWDI